MTWSSLRRSVAALAAGASLIALGLLFAGGPPQTGPATEKRFPPLKVPAGFKATLFACDPLIEYPSVMAAGPRPGAVFVAVDYMTGLGTEIVRRNEIRLVEDTDGDGYADKATVVGKGFNSIQGLAYHDGTLYVMHAPFLSALSAKGGEERRDLVTGLGLTPEQNPVRLHCANGVVLGHDGWLYLALGDHGADVHRPEGDRLVLRGGGILRCRPDGRDLHVFATGLRNIYDVALDAALNVFVRDNENDGGTYMVRVCHSFHSADHGYPYHYEEHPDEALPPLADLGRGSSAGGVCYLERQFPPEYRGDLFFCEWGRAVVRYPSRPAGSGFAPMKEHLFAEGDPADPYGFKPTDLVVQRDGTLMVADWADGQRPKRGRGRIYHIAAAGPAPQAAPPPKADVNGLLAQLDSESHYERHDAQEALVRRGADGRHALLDAAKRLAGRGRAHRVWALARIGGADAIDDLLRLAGSDPEPSVRAQAVRAAADLADPVLALHRLDARPGDAALARRFAELTQGQDAAVVREVVIALGRLRWAGLPAWLYQNLGKPDAPLAHAALQALRRSENWPAILKLLDEPPGTLVRTIALQALAERFEPLVVDGLIERLSKETAAPRRQEYAVLLARVCKKPGAQPYWGYRPAPRPANTQAWERTDAIAEALNGVLADSDRAVRRAVLERLRREQVPLRVEALARWLADETQADAVAALVGALGAQPAAEARPHLEAVVRDRRHTSANRLAALALFTRGLDKAEPLVAVAEKLDDGPVLAEALRRTAKHFSARTASLAKRKLTSPDAEVRAAAVAVLAEIRLEQEGPAVLALLADPDLRVRRAAAAAVGELHVRGAAEPLLKLAKDADRELRRACLDSLRRLLEPRAVPLAVAALSDPALELTALQCLAEVGGPAQADAVTELARHTPSVEVTEAAVRALTAWQPWNASERERLDHAVAQVQGANGILVRWQATAESSPVALPFDPQRMLFATGTEGRVMLAAKPGARDGWLASTEVAAGGPTPVELLASSNGTLQIWLNGQSVYRRDQPHKFQMDSDRSPVTLAEGVNRLLVQVERAGAPAEFHLRFRRKSASAEREKLAQAALSRPGDPEQGRKLFMDVEKSLCLKCHRLGAQGETIGPDLTGVGSRFARIYLAESILEPSRTIAPSYGSLVVTLKSGALKTGVKVAETPTTVTLADNEGHKHVLARADIEEQRPSPVSTMPEGFEKRFSEAQFVDLIAFLASQKQARAAADPSAAPKR